MTVHIGRIIMKTITQLLIGIGCNVLLIAIVQAGDLSVPNSFTAGTPARASEVNANFAAVKKAEQRANRSSVSESG